MTVPPRFTPHPDDEPQQGSDPGTSTPTPNFSSLQQPGGSTYAAPSSPRGVPREEPLPPRRSGAQNHFGGYSVTASGLGVFLAALVLIVFVYALASALGEMA